MIPDKVRFFLLECVRKGPSLKPHKLLALLSVIQLAKDNLLTTPMIYYDDNFISKFKENFSRYAIIGDSNRPHNPFFHLRNQGFWKLVAVRGIDLELNTISSIGGPSDLKRLVAYAEISQELFDALRSKDACNEIESQIIQILEKRKNNSNIDQSHYTNDKTSLFEHEEKAIQEIRQRIQTHNLGYVLQNLYIHDAASNSYLETDVVAICRFGIYVIELKHWTGNIQIRPNNWIVNAFSRKDPHIINNTKAKVLRSIIERRFPQVKDTYIESVVVLTNPDATIDGASVSKTKIHNPTFHGLDGLIEYLHFQETEKEEVFDQAHAKAVKDYLITLSEGGRPKRLEFPGYETVDYLYQHTDRWEIVAKHTDLRHQQLSRLRVFFVPQLGSPKEKQLYRERAMATINAVAKVGDHPNILKVWQVPNDYGYIVEGSDWSQEGTLRDVLNQQKKLDTEKALAIMRGILNGLQALHAKDVIHRALCPENILMVDGKPRLTNFDLSYQLEEERQTVIPDPSRLKRSPYIAPEVYAAAPTLSEKADFFSVGVILFELLTGERPFQCSTDLEQTDGVLSPQMRQKLGYLPASLREGIDRLIRLDAAQRPGNIESIGEFLGKVPKTIERNPNPLLQPGESDGWYEIVEFVQRGVESQIYKAIGPKGREIILKLFNIGAPLPRVINECELARAIQHPAIARVDNCHRWKDERFYIAFDQVKGSSLRSFIGNSKPTIEQFQRVGTMLLDGLEALHEFKQDGVNNPILHNDIKPENILITEGYRPVLIDFGIASHPHIDVYAGTKGYVAPDLQRGTDRDYCIGGDLYAVGATLFEWEFGCLPKDEELELDSSSLWADVNPQLRAWFRKALAKNAQERFQDAREMKISFNQACGQVSSETISPEISEQVDQSEIAETSREPLYTPPINQKIKEENRLERLAVSWEVDQAPNPFVTYLNTLHCRDAASENSLAESQAISAFFGHIHVPHPVAEKIYALLLEHQKRHVILTGDAGDGKSTIGLEIYKRIKGIPLEQPLPEPIKRREALKNGEIDIVLIKDFSEWKKEEQQVLLEEILQGSDARFLLISNTGTLLDTFRGFEEKLGNDSLDIESRILKAISGEKQENFTYHESEFMILNLAMMDNLALAEQIFQKMIDQERWQACKSQACRENCPILKNIGLMQQNDTIVRKRLFLAFRRMFEYGTRLTIRQITAHLAYMITAGLEYADIVRLAHQAQRPLIAEFMFYNRFFGDDGKRVDTPVLQLRSIKEVQRQGFGELPCPTWEKRLWLQGKRPIFRLRATGCEEEFTLLRELGARLRIDPDMSHGQARVQVRRMLYFLHPFDPGDEIFLKTFLRSSGILDFDRWQTNSNPLSLQEKILFKRRIFHVLQEHFTGVRIPEGTQTDTNIYITLTRRKREIRQSAQVVLARFDTEKEFELELEVHENLLGIKRRDLVLKGKGVISGTRLDLKLPFLDYVIIRNQGGVGAVLQTAFVDRLERFKAQLLKKGASSAGDNIMLVRLLTDHTFRRQVFAVHKDKIEVSDVH